jgi:predicted AAA+ superfamily ATPase
MTLKNPKYRDRLQDHPFDELLSAFGAVEITGCMWCGKTWMAEAHGNSKTKLMDPRVRTIVEADNRLAFKGEKPHIIDEWQEVPALWDVARMLIDDSGGASGQYILTGSSTPAKGSVSHSGTGRIARMKLRPMSLYEYGKSNGSVSLQGLFEGDFTASHVETDLESLAESICTGGWPQTLESGKKSSAVMPQYYLDTFVSSVSEQEGLDEQKLRRLLISLARNLGQAVTYHTIASDSIEGNITGKKELAAQAQIEGFLSLLKSRFLIEDVRGWDAPVRSKSRVRVKPKRSFVDPSLSAALLGIDKDRLLKDGQLLGVLFEELCLRDLRIYSSVLTQAVPDSVMHYRDSDNLEVDAIIELRDGRWAAIEIKLGENGVQKGVGNLLRLKKKIGANPLAQNPEPAFLAVLVGVTEFCRKTPEGVYVIPITELTA